MSTLADSFLSDLQGLEDDEDEEESDLFSADRPTTSATSSSALTADGGEKKKNLGGRGGGLFVENEDDDLEVPIVDAVLDYEKKLKSDYVAVVVSDLLQQPDFLALLEKVVALTPQEAEYEAEELELIEECNQRVIDIDKDILSIHKFIRDIYYMKFPELESIVQAPLEYIAVVLRIQNHTDLTQVDLSDLLPSPTIMALTVAASLSVSSSSSLGSAAGRRLPDEEFCKAIAAAKEALALADKRTQILEYLESRMSLIAPNVSNLLGAPLAARLLTRVGGLKTLAKMPSQNIMLVGSQKRGAISGGSGRGNSSGGVVGTSSSSAGAGIAFSSLLCSSEILLLTPPAFRTRALRLLAGKVALAARLDFFNSSREGSQGQIMREAVVRALIKAQQPPPAPQKKALPAPDERSRPKRGGKKYRRMKEKYELTEVHKQLNRMQFGIEEDQHDLKAKGLGMLGKSIASGRLKLQVKQQKLNPSKKRQQQMNRMSAAARQAGGTATALGSGTASSLTFTPIQGIELCNPEAAAAATKQQQENSGIQSFFSSSGKFIKVERDLTSNKAKGV